MQALDYSLVKKKKKKDKRKKKEKKSVYSNAAK